MKAFLKSGAKSIMDGKTPKIPVLYIVEGTSIEVEKFPTSRAVSRPLKGGVPPPK